MCIDDEEIEIISNEYSEWWNANPEQIEDYRFTASRGWPETMMLWIDEDYNRGPNLNY